MYSQIWKISYQKKNLKVHLCPVKEEKFFQHCIFIVFDLESVVSCLTPSGTAPPQTFLLFLLHK